MHAHVDSWRVSVFSKAFEHPVESIPNKTSHTSTSLRTSRRIGNFFSLLVQESVEHLSVRSMAIFCLSVAFSISIQLNARMNKCLIFSVRSGDRELADKPGFYRCQCVQERIATDKYGLHHFSTCKPEDQKLMTNFVIPAYKAAIMNDWKLLYWHYCPSPLLTAKHSIWHDHESLFWKFQNLMQRVRTWKCKAKISPLISVTSSLKSTKNMTCRTFSFPGSIWLMPRLCYC